MLMGTASFDRVTFPGDVWIVVAARIAPPPELIALVVGAENDVGVAVAINVINRSARFDGQKLFLDHASAPPRGVSPIPDQRRRFLPEAEDEVVDAISVQVGDDGSGLLFRLARYRQITVRAREMFPLNPWLLESDARRCAKVGLYRHDTKPNYTHLGNARSHHPDFLLLSLKFGGK